MISILTGDIIESRQADPKIWLPALETALRQSAQKFDIFRGDSFQAEVKLEDTFKTVFYLKSAMLHVNLDVRIGVGIGEKEVDALHIKNAFGSALIYSGEAFESLKRDTISVKSANLEYDNMCNIMMALSADLCGRWTSNMAEIVMSTLLHEDSNQIELARLLNRKHQSQISTALQKANYGSIKKAIDYCTQELLRL